jgi:hypothetical protein
MRRIILTLVAIAFGFSNLYAQHLFSISYNNLSQENAKHIIAQVAKSNTPITSLTKNIQGEYEISLSSVQNTKIIILNEETGSNVEIIPAEESLAQFRLQSFFIKELRQAVLGDADRYLIIEVGFDLSVINTASFSSQAEEVFIPRYLYGPKEDVQEALPEDREIIHIFKEKPRLIPAFPDDPENLRYVAQLEEEMNYYVYMYKLPDGTLCIYDEHFNPVTGENGVSTRSGTNLQFNLSGNLTAEQQTATEHAFDIWGAELVGTVPIDIHILFDSLRPGVSGSSRQMPHYLNPATQTWYCSALGNQIVGYNIAPGMSDIHVTMNSKNNWYYKKTGSPNSVQLDWITIMLHEMTHGLGFAALVKSNGGYLYVKPNGGIASTDFPGIYDRQLYEGTSGANLPDLNQSQRAALVASGNLFSGAPVSHLLISNNGDRIKMYAPTTYSDGSSVSHWDYSVTFSTFMKPGNDPGFKCHNINEREVAIMRDMGWEFPCPRPITINNKTYNSGLHSIVSCVVTISNTTIEPNTTVKVHGQEAVYLKPGFHAKAGSTVRISSGRGQTVREEDDTIEPDYSIGNDDAVYMLPELALAVETTEITDTDFTVYPNPNDGNFTVKITGKIESYTLEIFNAMGLLIGNIDCYEEAVHINQNDLPAGVYYLKMTITDNVVVKKVIIQ